MSFFLLVRKNIATQGDTPQMILTEIRRSVKLHPERWTLSGVSSCLTTLGMSLGLFCSGDLFWEWTQMVLQLQLSKEQLVSLLDADEQCEPRFPRGT